MFKNGKISTNLDKGMKLLGLHIDGALKERVNVPKKNLLFFDDKKYEILESKLRSRKGRS